MNAREISARDLRERQADILNQIAYKKGTQFIVTRHGKEAAAIISMKEFHLLEKVMEELEEEMDISDAKKAIKETRKRGSKSLNQLAKELGVDV
ncbi:MAG: type II toxin-antitoxin system prevent-host-death family antitoxin [Chlamydiia bacterium]|nr:type II toxin-antitoxin system prevent-host-death family antitoxin [Chlamydiia bacterium]